LGGEGRDDVCSGAEGDGSGLGAADDKTGGDAGVGASAGSWETSGAARGVGLTVDTLLVLIPVELLFVANGELGERNVDVDGEGDRVLLLRWLLSPTVIILLVLGTLPPDPDPLPDPLPPQRDDEGV